MCLSSKSITNAKLNPIFNINYNWIWISIINVLILQSFAFSGHSQEICISRSDANDIDLNCNTDERIAIFEAFFTTSIRHRCSQSPSILTTPVVTEEEEYENMYYYPRLPTACTDDLRLSMNRKCSGLSNCKFSFSKDHIPECVGEDGSVIIRYTCIPNNKFQPFCNLNLSDKFGYVSTPGYPKFYPPYDKCVWNIEGQKGQVIQIDLIDVAIREPHSKPSLNPKKPKYQCSDSLILKEENIEVLTLCGEVKTNLFEYRTKSNALTIIFKAQDFSPTRGLLFKYSLQNCATLPAPKNGHSIGRNGSFAYFTCALDHVFEDTKETEKVLFCESGNHWNSSLSKCIPKELSMSSSLTLSNDSNLHYSRSDSSEDSDGNYMSNILIPIVLMSALLVGNAVIVWVLFKLKRKQKTEAKNTESDVPLNTGSALQTNV